MGSEKFTVSLLAGSAAGTSVDLILFPLDTIKTRLQSANGFVKSGGFSGIYRGIGPAFIGSAPTAAIFFCTYDMTKSFYEKNTGIKNNPIIHMGAASLGEITACSIRVPVEIVKQRRQAFGEKSVNIFKHVLKTEGFKGFYRGYFSTIIREIPFSIIQFPLWEMFKNKLAQHRQVEKVSPSESAFCGMIAGGFSAAVTTPLDVAKTRIMLADASSIEARGSIIPVWRIIYSQKGISGLFAGVLPRTMWISLGGAIFFGTYEFVKSLLLPS